VCFEVTHFFTFTGSCSGQWLAHTSSTTSSKTTVISSEVAKDLGELLGKAVGKTKQDANNQLVTT
jgi:hypothetical protein